MYLMYVRLSPLQGRGSQLIISSLLRDIQHIERSPSSSLAFQAGMSGARSDLLRSDCWRLWRLDTWSRRGNTPEAGAPVQEGG